MGDMSVPYGIDRRPQPAGLDLNQLLPRQVGSYRREGMRLASHQNVEPATAPLDGDSVYADYRSGNAAIFVEFGANSRAADARMALETAAGETTGRFPTDPRFGSLGPDPSYLKVIDAESAFFAWTRGGYYFSASTQRGEAVLDAFLEAFPY